jgi:hypothetical protein
VSVPMLRLFFDTDAILAGSASTQGAAHLLLRLAELGLVEGITCAYVRDEALRNMARKLPLAGPLLEPLLQNTFTVIKDVQGETHERVHEKDLPVWLSFQRSGARYLITFNVRDYPRVDAIRTPGEVVGEIRVALRRISGAP